MRIIATGSYDMQRLAAELVVDERTIAEYISGAAEMPLDRQLCLARFAIGNVPELARFGRNLLGQIEAVARFTQSDTVVHASRPAPNSRSF